MSTAEFDEKGCYSYQKICAVTTPILVSIITKQSLYSPKADASERRIPLKSPVPKFTQNTRF